MAATVITNTNLSFNVFSAMPAAAAVDATAGALITPTGSDERMLIIVRNDEAADAMDVVVKGGDGPMATGDLTEEVAAGATKLIAIESGRYMNSAGKIAISGESANIKIACVFLPR
jgi:siroheme synthase